MPTRLYLDTARLGLMSRSARQVQTDFARLVGEEAGSLYLDEFLKCGAQHWPAQVSPPLPGTRRMARNLSIERRSSPIGRRAA